MNLDIGSDNMENIDKVVENILNEVDNGKIAVLKIPIDKFIEFDKKHSPNYWKDGKGFVFYNYVKYAFVLVKKDLKILTHTNDHNYDYEIAVKLPTGAKNSYEYFEGMMGSFDNFLKELKEYIEMAKSIKFYDEKENEKLGNLLWSW